MERTILCIVGTRPEVIKMAPIIMALKKESWARVRVLATAQHREMMDEALSLFGIKPDIDLDIMRPNQSLSELTSRLLLSLDEAMSKEEPAAVLAQGDTTTVLAAALASFYRRIPFFHVEAGLRTGDMENPFPEEMNRSVAGRLAHLHFAPTERARINLLAEGVPAESVHVTGNTVIDALKAVEKKDIPLGFGLPKGARIILLTAHRRESFGGPLADIFSAVATLAARHPELHFVYPVHPNPNVIGPAREILGNQAGVTLCEPLDYGRLVTLMKKAWLVLTDSGGLQEEAPALGKPVLVLRNETERAEAIESGCARLVGHAPDAIISAVENLLDDERAYQAMAIGSSPFGDGQAAERITKLIKGYAFREAPVPKAI
ncbi:MAG: UDP-N-acetylglucosamine 2-epimerase (non-hydrolyzing) [Nitrosomonadales bacterium]|nr:UDP-N-acetylglucosamine 2-epimerase (non-hydrolyzing) [Nitrosomonadales bacterium]